MIALRSKPKTYLVCASRVVRLKADRPLKCGELVFEHEIDRGSARVAREAIDQFKSCPVYDYICGAMRSPERWVFEPSRGISKLENRNRKVWHDEWLYMQAVSAANLLIEVKAVLTLRLRSEGETAGSIKRTVLEREVARELFSLDLPDCYLAGDILRIVEQAVDAVLAGREERIQNYERHVALGIEIEFI